MIDEIESRVIITWVKMDFNLHCMMPFGDYSQVYKKTGNTTTELKVGAICLGWTYNIQGGYKLYILKTIKRLECRQFTPCPMTQDVIDRVLQLGKKTTGTRWFDFQKQTRTNFWKIATDKPTIVGAVADTTGVNETP